MPTRNFSCSSNIKQSFSIEILVRVLVIQNKSKLFIDFSGELLSQLFNSPQKVSFVSEKLNSSSMYVSTNDKVIVC